MCPAGPGYANSSMGGTYAYSGSRGGGEQTNGTNTPGDETVDEAEVLSELMKEIGRLKSELGQM